MDHFPCEEITIFFIIRIDYSTRNPSGNPVELCRVYYSPCEIEIESFYHFIRSQGVEMLEHASRTLISSALWCFICNVLFIQFKTDDCLKGTCTRLATRLGYKTGALECLFFYQEKLFNFFVLFCVKNESSSIVFQRLLQKYFEQNWIFCMNLIAQCEIWIDHVKCLLQ